MVIGHPQPAVSPLFFKLHKILYGVLQQANYSRSAAAGSCCSSCLPHFGCPLVQTLPFSASPSPCSAASIHEELVQNWYTNVRSQITKTQRSGGWNAGGDGRGVEIGRASCRERV